MIKKINRALYIHPGIAKCATSYIQSRFVSSDYALSRDLGVRFLGRNFKVDSGYPEVSKLMYRENEVIDDIETADFSHGPYFLSNEALQPTGRTARKLASTLQIERILLTVRYPPLQALSNFRYSGWITGTLSEKLTSAESDPLKAQSRFERRAYEWLEISSSVGLCPVEPLKTPLIERFCRDCFGQVPNWTNHRPRIGAKRANQSVCFAFAEALGEAMSSEEFTVTNEDRNRLVKLVQEYPLNNELENLVGPKLTVEFIKIMEMALDEYTEFLKLYGVAPKEALEARDCAALEIRRLRQTPRASSKQMDELREISRLLIGRFATDV